jgi:magnesium-dependent phosphatase 1
LQSERRTAGRGMGKQLFVFDLDFTLWDAGGTWCDCLIPPFKMMQGKLIDSEASHIVLYPDVPAILRNLKEHNRKIAVASRSTSPKIAKELMGIFDIRKYVDYIEISPNSKTEHFIKLAAKSKLEFRDMVFFDDEYRNITDVALLGVECIQITSGLKKNLVEPYV